MSSRPYTEHDQYADQADDYLDQHNVYELFSGLMRKLVIHKPKDPLAFMIAALEQPVQQLRVVVVTPPHASASAALTRAVRELGVLRVRLSTLVAEESSAGNPLGVQAKSYVDAGNEVPEQIAVPLLAARLNKQDAVGKGWILEGYPNTRAQALALQAGGILPTHLLYFTTPASSSTSTAASTTTAAAAAAAAAQSDPVSAAAAASYVRHGASVQQVFAHVAHFLDLTRTPDALFEQLSTVLNAAPRTRAPKRPLRVLLLGAKGSGKHTQAGLLARKYNLLHVNASALLRAEVARVPALGEKVKHAISNGMLVSDEVINPLVVARLLQSDAKARGFVLEGFPRSESQAAALKAAGITPNRVVILTCPEDEARDRVTSRRVDPDTGDVYNVGAEDGEDDAGLNGLSSALRDRLVHRPNDQGPTVDAINFTIDSGLEAIRARYANVLREIHTGGRDTSTETKLQAAKMATFEQIEDFLLAPLNAKYAHQQQQKTGAEEKEE